VVPGATHLFEEPGTLEAAAGLARDWFISHLTHSPAGEREQKPGPHTDPKPSPARPYERLPRQDC
jgi:hypothetical protein